VLFDPYQLDWAAFDQQLFAHYQRLIALRRRHPALRRGTTAFIDTLPPGVAGFTRRLPHDGMLVLANCSAAAVTLDALPRHAAPAAAEGWCAGSKTLAPHGWMICPLDDSH